MNDVFSIIKFSIIIPFYNCESLVGKCIESILKQSYKNFEIILVNDGSNDNSLEIVKTYQQYCPNCILISQDNKGPYNARLLGANQATGDYLLFVDADDELHPDALSTISKALKRGRIDILLFNYSRFNDYSCAHNSPHLDNRKIYQGNRKKQLYWLILSGNKLNNLATKCISKELFAKIGFNSIEHFLNAEDLYMVVMLINRSKSIKYIDDVLYYYRPNSTSTTHNYNSYYYDSLRRTNSLCIEYSREWGNPIFVLLAHRRASRACVLAIKNVFNSSLGYKELLIEINRIIQSDFFSNNIFYFPYLSSKKDLLVYSLCLLLFILHKLIPDTIINKMANDQMIC